MGNHRFATFVLTLCLVTSAASQAQSVQPGPSLLPELLRHAAPAAPSGQGPFPVALLVPGCSGFDDKRFAESYRAHFHRLLSAGFAIVRVDYLKARAVRDACADRDAGTWEPQVAADIAQVIEHLPDTVRADRARIFIIGWSMGGGGALTALSTLGLAGSPPLAGVVALYPSCRAVPPWRSAVRTLLILADLDNIQPAALCNQLVQGAAYRSSVVVHRFEQAHHGFDIITEPLIREPRSVPTVAGNPEAATDAWRQIMRFLGGA